VLSCCRVLNSESVSSSVPTMASAAFVTEVQPEYGVTILTRVPANAVDGPYSEAVAVTVASPAPSNVNAGRTHYR